MNKPSDWPGTDSEWDEYQTFIEDDQPKAEDKIVGSILQLTNTIASIPKGGGYETVTKQLEALVHLFTIKLQPTIIPPQAKKWKFTVHRNEKEQIVDIIAERD